MWDLFVGWITLRGIRSCVEYYPVLVFWWVVSGYENVVSGYAVVSFEIVFGADVAVGSVEGFG